jgi:hypothetical protein
VLVFTGDVLELMDPLSLPSLNWNEPEEE